MSNELPVIDHAGVLEDAEGLPAWVSSEASVGDKGTPYSCSFCGVGDSGFLQSSSGGQLELSSDLGDGDNRKHYSGGATVTERTVRQTIPTAGCVKLKLSMASQRPAFPIHVAPSVLEPDGSRRTISYEEAIDRFAELQLAHRGDLGKTLFYACGQIDYFSIFAIQEAFRLLGVRNLTGNAEHCLNAGAVHNEILTGQEGPFLTIDQSVGGPDRFFLMNGWNGLVTHPPVYRAIAKREDLDAFLVEVAVTETAIDLAKKLGPERVLLIRPRSDPQLALSVAHELLNVHSEAVENRFIEHFSDTDSFEKFSTFARKSRFEPRNVASRIAPEAEYEQRLEDGIRMIARKLADQRTVPINIPSVGLSQSSGVVAHCLWGSALAMLGKYGLKPSGGPAGGTLRIPGQINAESEVQGLSRKYYMGRIPIDQTAEAARRMGLPDDAYQGVVDDEPRAALDYAKSAPNADELFVFMGTQFEANMMDRRRWITKLKDPHSKIVVIDPIPDPFTLEFADLIIPAPPHIAATKLYQNGEWKMSLSVPGKHAPPETRSDATIIYDLMAAVTKHLAADESQRKTHQDLTAHLDSGYLEERFGSGLARMSGEVDRAQLWQRVQDYMAGGSGPLYCSPEHADGRPIEWKELVEHGAIVYGGVGVNRYMLDYDKPDQNPFAGIFKEPRKFTFFVPTEDDLHIPQGMILNSGRSSMSSDRKAIQFATASFNSGKATPLVNMPDEAPCHVSPMLAAKLGLGEGDRIRVTGRNTGAAIELPAVITDRVKGETAYVSFHKSRAQIEEGVYVNDVTTAEERCAYCSQTSVKSSLVLFERVSAKNHKPKDLGAPTVISGLRDAGESLDTSKIDTRMELPVWSGQDTPLYVNEIIEETHDVYTFRLQGDPLCRFAFLPGQFCSLVLNIEGKKVVRSYTISSTPTRPYVLEITVKRVPGGLVSNWLPDNLKVGDRIEVAGPKGKFHLLPGAIPRKVLFLGAGSGITPVMSMSRWLCDVAADVDIQMFNSVRSPDDIIFAREFDYMVERYQMFSSIQVSGTRGTRGDWTGLSGHISRPMLELVSPDMFEREIFMCGPQGFMDAAREILDGMGFDLAKLHSESFGGVRTSIADKSSPLGGGAAEGEGSEAGSFTVEFAAAGVTAMTDGRESVLDVAEAHDVDLDYGCRTGSCGDCKAKLITGEIDLVNEEGLEPGERDAGFILTCVARPKGDCVIDA
jgi:glycine betaine catabolism B